MSDCQGGKWCGTPGGWSNHRCPGEPCRVAHRAATNEARNRKRRREAGLEDPGAFVQSRDMKGYTDEDAIDDLLEILDTLA